MHKLYWRLFIIRLALRWINKFNLGDEVVYKGERWTLIQGVCAPRWSLVRGDHADRTFQRLDALESEFRKVRTPKALWQSFRSGYRFYMQSWYSIWLREGIRPWMAACNIWAGRAPRISQ